MKKITLSLLLLSAAFSWSQQQLTAVALEPSCAPVPAFYQNFDNVTVPQLPVCWAKILRGETLDSEAYIKSALISSVYTAPNAIELYNGSSNVVAGDDSESPIDDIILVSSELTNLHDHTNRLRFFAQGEGSLQIGTLDGNGPDAVFQPIATISTSNDATQYIVNFNNYNGTDTRIGIRMNNANYHTSVFVDGISWEVIPTCPDVSNITVPSVTPNGATVQWNEGGTESAWEVAVASITVNDPDTVTAIPSETTTKLLAGLDPATQYKVWVRSVCSSTDKGVWTGPVFFTTACLATDYVNESFDNVTMPDVPTCWSTIVKGPTIEGSTIQTSEYNYHTAPHSIALYSVNPTEVTEGTNDVILVSPNLTTVEGGYRLKFFAQGGATLQIGTLDTNTDSAVFTPLAGQNDITATTGEPQEYIVEFGGYTGTDHYVGIRVNNSSSGIVAYLDNIVWEAIPSCLDVTDIYASGISPTTADISWAAGDAESAWDVVYSDVSVNPNTLTSSSTSSTTTTLVGLTPATTYYAWVRSVCGTENKGAWVGPILFKTDCAPVDSFVESFDGGDSGELPTCWKAIVTNAGALAYVKTSTESVHSAPNCVKLSNGITTGATVMLVSPSVSSLPLASHQLEFYARNNDDDVQLEIGTLDSNNPDATFTSLEQFVTLTGTTAHYVVEFGGYTGSDQYIGMRLSNAMGSSSIVFMDDIKFRAIPLCPDVTNISALSVGTATADLGWSEVTGSTWQVAYAPSTITDPSEATILDTSVGSISLTGLTGNTIYNVWVRSICNEGDGDWVGPVVIHTLCDAVDLPYIEDFETAVTPDIPACTSVSNLGQGNIWQVADSGVGFDSHVLSYTYNAENAANTWFYTKGINLVANTPYTISYKYGTSSSTDYPESFKVMYGLSPDLEGMVNPIAEHTNFVTSTPATDSFDFTPQTTGVYYFGFNEYSEAFMDSLYIDDIKVSSSLAVGGNEMGQFKFYPNPVKDQLNLSYNSSISSVLVYNLLGQQVLAQTVNSNDVIVNVSTLAKGTYMVKVNAGTEVKVIKMIKE